MPASSKHSSTGSSLHLQRRLKRAVLSSASIHLHNCECARSLTALVYPKAIHIGYRSSFSSHRQAVFAAVPGNTISGLDHNLRQGSDAQPDCKYAISSQVVTPTCDPPSGRRLCGAESPGMILEALKMGLISFLPTFKRLVLAGCPLYCRSRLLLTVTCTVCCPFLFG